MRRFIINVFIKLDFIIIFKLIKKKLLLIAKLLLPERKVWEDVTANR